MVSRVSAILAAVVLSSVSGLASAQQTGSLPQASQADGVRASKAELAAQFQDLKTQFAPVAASAAKYVVLKSDAPVEVKTVRLKISAALRSYDYLERDTQKLRDDLNRLTELTELQSLRLKASMGRLARMRTFIAELMEQINDTGDGAAESQGRSVNDESANAAMKK